MNGTAEAVANPYYGLVWSVAPLSYGLSMAVGEKQLIQHLSPSTVGVWS